jgi:peptidoglycan/LPS O-acetylase OafA/YrhL
VEDCVVEEVRSMRNSATETGRVYGLDLFRAVAILFVLIGHVLEHSLIIPQLKTFGRLGIFGVELFFVLSGFLIGSIIMRLMDKNKFDSLADISTFWKRRWLRTLPLYFVVLLAFLRFDYHGRHQLLDYPLYFVFMQNFVERIPEFFELSWSLAIEEHFYFWFPLVYFVLTKITGSKGKSFVFTALIFIGVSLLFRALHATYSDWNYYNGDIRMVVLSRLDAIMFGVLVAALKHYWLSGFQWLKRITPITALMLVVLFYWWFAGSPWLMESKLIQVNLFTVQAVLCAMLLPWFDSLRSDNLRDGFISITSRLSYSLYLMHILVIIFINNALSRLGLFEQIYNNPFLLYPLYFAFFYFVAWLTYNHIEAPFIKLRDEPLGWREIIRASWVAASVAILLVFVF